MKVLIINNIEASINCDRLDIRTQLEDLLDDDDNAYFKTFVSDQNLMEIIYETLDKPSGVTACNIWEDKHSLYAGYFIDIAEKIDYEELDNLDLNSDSDLKLKKYNVDFKSNILGSQITSQHVTSKLIIVKQALSYSRNDNNIKTETTPCDIGSLNNILNIFESLFIKDGVVIKSDGSMHSYKYIMNPLENIILTDPDYEQNYVYHEYEIYTHIIIIIADTRQKNGTLNVNASFLAGSPVKGDVFVALYKKPEYNETPPYVTLSTTLLTDILFIRKKSVSLTTGLNRADREYINFLYLIDLEKKTHSNKLDKNIRDLSGQLLNLK